jgi:glutathione synthase/RimK-type ligase-like ATP-grasp enzyme
LDDALALSEDEWTAQPVIVQRRVMGDDARVIVFNGECFGATCSTTDIDWRVAGSGATWSKWEVPEPLADQCLTYLQSFGLRYGAFDFILNENQCWFLEANQAGEWVFLDRPLKLGIAQALTDYLARLAIGSAE